MDKIKKLFISKSVVSVLITIYLVVVFGIYPLYLKNGYYDNVYVKTSLLWTVSRVAAILLLLAILCEVIVKKNSLYTGMTFTKFDLGIFIYLFSLGISTISSVDKQTAVWGQDGWYMGYFLIFISCAFSAIISKLWKPTKLIFWVIVISSTYVFLMGIFNRFGLFIVSGGQGESQFISTLGHIGWFNGFYSVVAAIVFGFYIVNCEINSFESLILKIYIFIAFLIGLAQSGESILLIYASILSLGILLENYVEGSTKRTIHICIIGIVAGQALRLLMYFFSSDFTATDMGILSRLLTYNFLNIFGILVCFLLLLIEEKCPYRARMYFILRVGVITVWILAIVWFFTSILYTHLLSEGKISESSFDAIFLLALNWGNCRGAIYRIATNTLAAFDLKQILFGVGPDCFGVYLYNNQASINFSDFFNNSVLTNAHNEILNNLINTGICGTVAFAILIVIFIKRCFLCEKNNKCALIGTIVVCSYLTYNILNYAQIFNFPLLMFLMGMIEAFGKYDKNNSGLDEADHESKTKKTTKKNIDI